MIRHLLAALLLAILLVPASAVSGPSLSKAEESSRCIAVKDTVPGQRKGKADPEARRKRQEERMAAYGPAPDETLVYAGEGDDQLQLLVWKPEGWKMADRRPAILFIQGNGWGKNNPHFFRDMANTLADSGLVTISVQFRSSKPGDVSIRECLDNSRSAFEWVRNEAGKLGIDPNRIAVLGYSYGGYLAASLGTFNHGLDGNEKAVRPGAMILVAPALKLDSSLLAKSAYGIKAKDIKNLSPMEQRDRLHPPTLILQGLKDTVQTPKMAEDYGKNLRKLEVPCTYSSIKDQGHDMLSQPAGRAALLSSTIAFLREQGWLEND